MYRSLLALSAAIVLVLAAVPVQAQVLPGGEDQTWIVVLDVDSPAVERAQGLIDRFGRETEFVFENVINGFTFTAPKWAAQLLALSSSVISVEPSREFKAVGEFASNGFLRIEADLTRAAGNTGLTQGGESVRLAILDTGILTTHPDLSANLDLAQSTNCIDPGSVPEDDNGHGTHVAGSAAAANQGTGLVGVASDAKLVVAKVLNSLGKGTEAQVICGLDFIAGLATDGVPTVVNLSLGENHVEGPGCSSSAMHQAICNLTDANVTVVAAAGNDGSDGSSFYPAAYPETISVSAFTALDGTPGLAGCEIVDVVGFQCDDTLASFTNYGLTVDVAAPGVKVYSTTSDGSFGLKSGTSMAAPFAAGVAALVLAADPTLSPSEVRSIMQVTGECPNGATAGAATCTGQGVWLMSDGLFSTSPEPDGIPEPLINAPAAVAAAMPVQPAPTLSLLSPVSGTSVAAPLLIEGLAADDVAVTGVSVEVFDHDTGQWWDGAGWQVGRRSFPGTVVGGSWSVSFDPGVPVSAAGYWMTARSFDGDGNASDYAFADFSVTSGAAPTLSLLSPVSGTSVAAPLLIEGLAADDVAVTGVSVEVFDHDTGQWWDGAGWQVGRRSFPGTVVGGSWSVSFDPGVPVSAAGYWMTARSFDGDGNASDYAFADFSVTSGAAPTLSLLSPVSGTSVAAPLLIEGLAADDVAVTGVSVEVFDHDTGQWWDGAGWQVGRRSFPGTVVGGSWSVSFDPGVPVSAAGYWMTARSFDGDGNASDYAFADFSVTSGAAPTLSLLSPVSGTSVAAPLLIEGLAADDVAVTGVSVEVFDHDTGQWWDGAGWQVGRRSFPGTVVGGSWSVSFDPGVPVSAAGYWMTARSFDGDGNASDYAFADFSVTSGAAPTLSLLSPVSGTSVAAPLLIEGLAADDVAVTGVSVEVFDHDTGQWWDGAGWQVGRRSFPGTVVGGSWSVSFDPGVPVSAAGYWMTARSFDGDGNASDYAFADFNITAP